nr:hypothetical protein DWUX_386 [Desulfovibrio diazotrophicus]
MTRESISLAPSRAKSKRKFLQGQVCRWVREENFLDFAITKSC